jgi:hypothetical protein
MYYRNKPMTISLRLDRQLARRLASAAEAKGMSKSELIRQCLGEYLAAQELGPTAWELGRHLFGCYNSGHGELSVRAKEIARERIHARRAQNSHR